MEKENCKIDEHFSQEFKEKCKNEEYPTLSCIPLVIAVTASAFVK
jgi:hypothetical protein